MEQCQKPHQLIWLVSFVIAAGPPYTLSACSPRSLRISKTHLPICDVQLHSKEAEWAWPDLHVGVLSVPCCALLLHGWRVPKMAHIWWRSFKGEGFCWDVLCWDGSGWAEWILLIHLYFTMLCVQNILYPIMLSTAGILSICVEKCVVCVLICIEPDCALSFRCCVWHHRTVLVLAAQAPQILSIQCLLGGVFEGILSKSRFIPVKRDTRSFLVT